MKERIIEIRTYTMKELAALYGVHRATFRKWLEPFQETLGKRNGYYFSISQVKLIFKKIQLPSSIKLKEYSESDFDE